MTRIYVADSKNNRIVVFDSKGRYLSQFGEFGIAKPPAGSMRHMEAGAAQLPDGRRDRHQRRCLRRGLQQ